MGPVIGSSELLPDFTREENGVEQQAQRKIQDQEGNQPEPPAPAVELPAPRDGFDVQMGSDVDGGDIIRWAHHETQKGAASRERPGEKTRAKAQADAAGESRCVHLAGSLFAGEGPGIGADSGRKSS